MIKETRVASFANFSGHNPPTENDESVGEVCIANISPRERQKRLWVSVAAFAITLAVLTVLIANGVDPVWRLVLLFMFWGAGVPYFEARDKTCIALAINKSRKIGEVEEKIEDVDELKQVRHQSRRLIIKAFYMAVAFTLIAYLIP